VLLLGGGSWAVWLAGTGAGWDVLTPVMASAVVVGLVGQTLALRARSPSVIWTVPAILPLLPGLAIVRGILDVGTVGGVLTIVSAIGTGFALGAGVAFGSIVVVAAREAGAAAQDVVVPVLDEARARGLPSPAGLARTGRRGRGSDGPPRAGGGPGSPTG
jgi:uncharacterized membrane protein YjjB (DUF3815 family)